MSTAPPPDRETNIQQYGGIKDDTDAKQTPDQFFTAVTNFKFPDISTLGFSMTLCPLPINRLGISTGDGLYEYRYLDLNSVLQTTQVAVTNGTVFINALSLNTPFAVTFTANPTNTVNKVLHGLANGAAVSFTVDSTGVLPASLTVNQIYFVINTAANTFQVATTPTGSAIVFATAGTTPTQYAEANPSYVKTGLTAGKCTFVTFQDNLFICNGKNYPQVYWGAYGVVAAMGAPAANVGAAGVPNGTYYYAQTYILLGSAEEVLGSVSNTITVSSSQIVLQLPIGYPGTLTRKIYRTAAGGSQLKLVTTISDNTTLTYTDNTGDGGLGVNIPPTNNEMVKPYFITVANQKLYGGKITKLPTQVFVSDTNNQIFDPATGLDVANYGDDNTPVSAVALDYDKVVVGTGKHFIFLDPITGDVVRTRANVGILDGYSCQLCPAFGNFPGGLFFVSTLHDVRLLTGTQQAAVFQTLDNIKTDSWSQNIRTSLTEALQSYQNISSFFFNYKYGLEIDNQIFLFDTRTQGWTTQNIQTTNFQSSPRTYAVMGTSPQLLYNFQSDGVIEEEYYPSNYTYHGENIIATLTSAMLDASRLYKWLKKFVFWLRTSTQSNVTVKVVLDSNTNYPITGAVTLFGAPFNPLYFNATYFLTTGLADSEFRVINIPWPCRWAQFTLTCTSGNIDFIQWGSVGTPLQNSEKVL